MSKEKYVRMVADTAPKYGVPVAVLAGLIQTESDWKVDANARANGLNSSAHGLAQFLKGTAKQYGVDVTDAASSIDGAARYLRDLQKKYGDWSLAIRAYHDGPGNVDKALAGKGGLKDKEAQEYVGKVLKAGSAYGEVPADKTGAVSGKGNTATPAPSLLQGTSIPVANPNSTNPALKSLKLAPVEMDLPSPTITARANQPVPSLSEPLDAAALGLQPVPIASAPAQPQTLGFDTQMASLETKEKPMGLTSLLEGAFGAVGGKTNMLQPTRPRGYDAMLDRLIG